MKIVSLPGPNTVAALAVADLAVVPVTAPSADIRATRKALDLVKASRKRRRGRPRCLLVPAKVDMRTRAGKELPEALAGLGEPVGPRLGQRTAHVEAYAAGRWVGDYAPGSPAHREIMALARAVEKALS